MANRSRLMSQMSGIALAAFVAASMSVQHGVVAVGGAGGNSTDRQDQTQRATNIDLGPVVPNMYHHY